jgi:capsular polysaccharide transport system permease protein
MSSTTELFASARIQRRIIGALVMREILTRYGRGNVGYMWLFIEPMMFTSGVLILWTALRTENLIAVPIIAFTLSGYMTVLLWRNCINRCGNAIEPNRALMHHRNVRVIDMFAARVVLEISGVTMAFLIMGLGLCAAGAMSPPEDLLKMIFAWLLLAWFSLDMAFIVGSLVVINESVERIWHVFGYLFLPLSGAFYMVSWLPKFLQSLALWIPTVNCTELLREGLFGSRVVAHYSIQYVLMLDVVLMLPALLLIRYVASRVEGE